MHRNVLTQLVLERLRGQALRTQQHIVTILAELPILLQGRNRHDHRAQAFVRHNQIALDGLGCQHTLCHQCVERGTPHFRVVKQCGINAAPQLLTQSIHLLALGIGELLLGNRIASHIGHGVRIIRDLAIPIDTEERKRWNDQNEQQKLHQALVGTNELKHGLAGRS